MAWALLAQLLALVVNLVCPLKVLVPSTLTVAPCLLLAHLLHELHLFLPKEELSATMSDFVVLSKLCAPSTCLSESVFDFALEPDMFT